MVTKTEATLSTIEQKVVRALENDKYKWRTIGGVAKEARMDVKEVYGHIQKLNQKGVVIRSSVPAATGEELFTTRKHYRDSASFTGRVVAALRNRGA